MNWWTVIGHADFNAYPPSMIKTAIYLTANLNGSWFGEVILDAPRILRTMPQNSTSPTPLLIPAGRRRPASLLLVFMEI